MNIAVRLFNEPFPIRKICQVAIRRLKVGSYPFRYSIGAVVRPNYAFLVYQAAWLATRLGQPKVSILEFGCAGGQGLLALESHAEEVEKLFPIKIEIYGFDTGEGILPADDYRDSDGIDGNTQSAGAIADPTTVERARLFGYDPARSLAEFNACPLFTALGDAVVTGPTGHNLRDMRLLISELS